MEATGGQPSYRQVPNGAPPGHYLGQLIKNGGIGLFYLKETYFPQLIKNVQIVPRGGTIWHLTVLIVTRRQLRKKRLDLTILVTYRYSRFVIYRYSAAVAEEEA